PSRLKAKLFDAGKIVLPSAGFISGERTLNGAFEAACRSSSVCDSAAILLVMALSKAPQLRAHARDIKKKSVGDHSRSVYEKEQDALGRIKQAVRNHPRSQTLAQQSQKSKE